MDDMANNVANITDAAPRKPGRPKGSPKPPGSGRQKGTPNKATKEIAEIAQKHGKVIVDGLVKEFKTTDDLDVKVKIASLVLSYGYGQPTRRAELTGADGGPIQQRTEILAASQRVVAAMAEASTADDPAVAMDAEGLHGIKAISFLAARQAAQERDQAPARPSTPAVDLPAPEPSGEPVESVEEDPLLQGEPEAPDPGHALRFMGSDWYIKGFGPVREGLPNVYELRCPSGLVRRGPFAMCMDLLTTQMGGDVGEWTDQVPERLARANTS